VESQNNRPKNLMLALSIAGGILLAHLVTAAWAQVQAFVVIVVAGVFAGLAMEPAVAAMHRRGVRRGLAAWGILFLTFSTLAGLAATVGAVGVSQVSDLLDRLPELAAQLQQRLAGWNVQVDLVAMVNDRQMLSDLTTQLKDKAVDVSTGAPVVVSKLLAVAFVAFWVSCEGAIIRSAIARLVPVQRRARVEQVWDIAVERTGGYLNSRVTLGFIASAVFSVGFTVVGSEYAIPLALWAGIVSTIVPLVGSYLGIGLPILIALGSDPMRAVWVLLVFLGYQQVKNLFIGPRVMRRAVKLHPLVGFSAVVTGAALAGGVGALLAIPIVATGQGIISAMREPMPDFDPAASPQTAPETPAEEGVQGPS
jgi:predicted PurR-regulated permease PerM